MATKKNQGKRMEYRKVSYDVNEIAPDAPEGEWGVSIPRGKCRVRPTNVEKYPMLIVPIRLDSTEEDGGVYQKVRGTELSSMIVFFGDDADPRAVRMSKLRLRQLCEAADVDLDVIPKELGDDPEAELQPLIRELEGKKFTAWTRHQVRKDTGETTTEVVFNNPSKPLASSNDEDEDDAQPEEEKTSRVKKPASKAKSNGTSKRR